MTSAKGYVRLAERAHGRIASPVDFPYIWGDALAALRQGRPHVRIINLETSVTRSGDYWKGKGIHYRMSPQNARCITAAGIDVCVLGNNHVLDWGYAGLAETLKTLTAARVKTAGAGTDLAAAQAPAVCEIAQGVRVLVFSWGRASSGIARSWAAGKRRAGVHFLPTLGDTAVRRAAELVRRHRRGGDIVVASIHWGGNWGYRIPAEQRRFAHRLLEAGGVDLIHGHSSHHAKGIEVYRGKLILYGCGDLVNDYEGISGREAFRGDLGLMYFASLAAATGRLLALRMVPMQMRRFQLRRVSPRDAKWLQKTLDRECRRLRARVALAEDNALRLEWEPRSPGRPGQRRRGEGR
jgi:poly-gamma-glutamate synthesis protein (capsule biosynthesis protein)